MPCSRILALRNEPPPDKRDEGQADNRRNASDRREIEHRKAFAQTVCADRCDQDVGWRADQCHHAPEDRCKRQRHQRARRWPTSLAGGLHINWHQERERGDVVHKGRQHAANAADRSDMGGDAALRTDELPGDETNCAGSNQAGRDDQNTCHDHCCWVAKPQKRLRCRDQTGQHGHKQSREGHKIITKPPPQKESEDTAKDGKEKDLISRHGSLAPSELYCGTQCKRCCSCGRWSV